MAVPESSVESSRPTENMNKKKKDAKIKDKKVIVAAQEIKYAKYLAGNEKKTRDRALKSLTKWLQQRCIALPFSEADFMLLWKGLFYSMWMSDKPLVQEECAESIAHLVHSLTPDSCIMFFKCGLMTLGNEWFGIDQLRMDKFLMLVRRMLRQGFVALKQQNWSMKMVKEFQQVLDDTVLNTQKKLPLGLTLHFTEIYLEELAKVSEGKIHPMLLLEFLVPFTKQLSLTNEQRQIVCVTKNIFRQLMRQSDIGLEYNEKFHAWKRMGFPGGNINALQKGDVSDDEKMSDEEEQSVEEKVLDPRAGRVNVVLPQLKFNPKHMVNLLTKYRFAPGSNTKSRKAVNKLIAEFAEMMHGRYPLGMKKVEHYKEEGKSTKMKQSVNRLFKLEKKLQQNSKKRKAGEEFEEQPPSKKQKNEIKSKKGELSEKKKLKHKQNDDSKKVNLNGKKIFENSFEENSDVSSSKKPKLLKNKTNTKVDMDSDESLPAEEVFTHFESAFPRNSGTWYVYNGDTAGGGDRSNDKSWVMSEEVFPEQNDEIETEKIEVKKRKMRKPVKWNKNSSIQLIKESLNSPKRATPKKINGGESAKKLIFTSQTIVPPRNTDSNSNESPKKPQFTTSSPKKNNDRSIIASPKKTNDISTNGSLKETNDNKSAFQVAQEANNSLNVTPKKQNDIKSPPKKLNNSEEQNGSVKKIRHSPKLAEDIVMNNDEGSSPALNGVKNMIEIKKQSPKRSENAAVADTQVNFEPEEVSTPKKNLFMQTDWDSPLKDGEIEFFVTSNKYKQKMEKLAKQSKQNMSDLINTSLARVKGKARASLDPNLVRNPFAKNGTPRSGKKVKIDLRLNKSQEIHEHVATIKRSPAIPFDANKKPVKPLLKPNAVSSPINPFYKRRLNL